MEEQDTLRDILDALMKDENFGHSIVKSLEKILSRSQLNDDARDSFKDVVDKIFEYCEGRTCGGDSKILGLRENLIGMLKGKQFLAFGRVLRMLQDLFGYSDARVVNYLKKIVLQKGFDIKSNPLWIDVPETSKAIREGLNPRKMDVIAKLKFEQKCILRDFSSKQLNVMSMFSLSGINMFSRIGHLPQEQSKTILGLRRKESRLFKDFGYDKIRILLNFQINERNSFLNFFANDRDEIVNISHFLQQYSIGDEQRKDLREVISHINSDHLETLRQLFNRDTTVLRSLTSEAADLAESIYQLSDEEKNRYLNLDKPQLDVLNNLNEEQKNVIMQFQDEDPSFNEILQLANSMNSDQRDLILSLSEEDMKILIESRKRGTLPNIEKISRYAPEIIRSSSVLNSEEQDAIMELSKAQRSVLLKAHNLGHDGLSIMRNLGPELTSQVFERHFQGKGKYEKLSSMQNRLMRKLDIVNKGRSNDPIYFNKTAIARLFGIICHESHSLLSKLSWRGIKLLERLNHLDGNTIDIVRRLSTNNVQILTRNDKLTEKEILELELLELTEAKVLIDLNLEQRDYLSSRSGSTRLRSPLFNPEERNVLNNLSTTGRRVLSSIIILSSSEKRQLQNRTENWNTILKRMSPMEFTLFSTLSPEQVRLLSSFMIWHAVEDLVFTQLKMNLDTPLDRFKKIETFVHTIPRRMKNTDHDKVFKLFASTIEVQRVTGVITDDFIHTVTASIENIHGKISSLIFKLQLLNLSMRDSKSLEALLVPQITGNPQDIHSICRTNEISSIEDVMFMRWILSQPPDLNGGIFYEFAKATLTRLPIHIVGQELDILLSKSKLNIMQHLRVLDNFRLILKENHYSLASSFLVGHEKNSNTISESVTGALIKTLSPNDCFELFDTPINQIVLDKIHSSSMNLDYFPSILSDGRFPDPNVLEVLLYYNLGDPLPLLKMLEKDDLWKLFERRSYSLLQFIARNYETELSEIRQRIEPINQLINAHRVLIFDSLIKDLEYQGGYSKHNFYLSGVTTIRDLAYSGSSIGKETYITMFREYMSNLQRRASRGMMKMILDSFISEDVNRDDLIRSLNGLLEPDLYLYLKDDVHISCASFREKRAIQMVCADSENTKEIKSEEEKQSIRRTIDITLDETKLETSKLYDELLEYSQRKFQGEPVDLQVERALIVKIKDVHLESTDPRITDIIKRIKDNSEDQEKIDSLLKQPRIMNKINKVASTAGLAFTVLFVGKHVMHGDIESLGYDAMYLWVLPKIGERITEKLTDLAERYDSAILEGFAPMIGAAVGNLAAFVGLVEGIRARINSVDPIDEKLANLNIITNSVFIATNVPVVSTQMMTSLGAEFSVMGELTGPIGSALSVAVVITSYLISVGLEVEQLSNKVKLSEQEKRSLYWSFIEDESIPENLCIDLTAKEMYTLYINNYLDRFKRKYDRIAVSLPRILMTDKECIANTQSPRFRRSISSEMSCGVGCMLGERNKSYTMDFSQTEFARNPFSTNHVNQESRLIPDKLEDYEIVCGPSAKDAMEQNLVPDVPEVCSIDSVYHDTKWNIETKELFIPLETNDNCGNMVAFRSHGSSNSTKILFYLSQNASIALSNTDSMDMMFHGKNISITDRESTEEMHIVPQNRYYFDNELDDCSIHKKGENFFYLDGRKEFKCDLGDRSNKQHNIVVIRSNFKDSNNIHSILGSERRERIEARFAEYIDGNGGSDLIQATERTVVKGYFNDFVIGKCLVLLSLNVTDIDYLLITTRVSIHNKEDLSLKVDQNTALITADGYLFIPIRSSCMTHKMTYAHIRKTLETEIILDNELAAMRNITIPNCTLIKQLSSANYDIILSDVGQNIFHTDKNHHEFYWESSGHDRNFYVLGKLFVNVTISKAHGILDFRDLKMEFNSEKHFFHHNSEHEIEISIGGLHVTLLPNYKNVTITFDGKKYYKLEYDGVSRDWCSHSLPIVGKIMLNGTDIHDYPNCFEFDSQKILFFKLEDDLILVSGRQVLTILKFYSSLHEKKELSLKLNGEIMKPDIFEERTRNPHEFVYYNVTSGLLIYHNQPVDKRHIGFVNLKDKSIKDFDMTMKNSNLLLLYRNVTLVRMENWENYQPGRQLMFAFEDSFLDNAGCIVSYCKSNDIIEEFEIEKTRARHHRPKRNTDSREPIFSTNNASGRFSWINELVNVIMKPIHNACRALFYSDHSNYSHYRTKLNDRYLDRFSDGFHITSNINLIFVLLQNFLKNKYPFPKVQASSSEETLVNVMDLIEEYKRLLNDTARRFNVELKIINFFQLYSDIVKLVKREDYYLIPNVMYLALEEIYPRDQVFSTYVKGNIKQMFDRQKL